MDAIKFLQIPMPVNDFPVLLYNEDPEIRSIRTE